MKEHILNILKQADGYVSGEDMSRRLNISRSAVWKHISRLRDEGYNISSVTNKGYRLNESDIISESEIKSYLNTLFIGKKIIYTEETDSTNNDAKRNSALPEGTVFTSEIQTGGKGRRGKVWTSPKGVGAWFSILLKPDITPEIVSRITLIAGLAVCRGIGTDSMIKYPNDTVIGTKKVSGILTELSAETDAVNYVICGIGINVNTESFDDELKNRATSLYIETGKKHDRCKIIARVLNEFEKLYIEFLNNGLKNIIQEYKNNCVTLNNNVSVVYNNLTIQGKCVDITDKGTIIINDGHKDIEINSGEVSVRGIYGYV